MRVYTDHKNLTSTNSNYSSDRILRQRLLVEEYGEEIIYVKGYNDVVADALSRLPMESNHLEDGEAANEELFLEINAFEYQITFPLDLDKIKDHQKDCNHMEHLLKTKSSRDKFIKRNVQDTDLWTYHGNFFVPKSTRAPLVEWFHENL